MADNKRHTDLLNKWLSTLILEYALKSSGSSITGIVTCINSFICKTTTTTLPQNVWLCVKGAHSPCGWCPTSAPIEKAHSPWTASLSGVSLGSVSFSIWIGPGRCWAGTFWQTASRYTNPLTTKCCRSLGPSSRTTGPLFDTYFAKHTFYRIDYLSVNLVSFRQRPYNFKNVTPPQSGNCNVPDNGNCLLLGQCDG